MYWIHLLLLTLWAFCETQARCGTPPPSAEQLEQGRQFAIQEADDQLLGISRAQAVITADVWLHSVASRKSNLIPESVLRKQFWVLVDTYAPYGITFRLKGITRVVDEYWSTSGDEMSMKRALRRGDYRTLNIYYVEGLRGDLGYCYYPTITGGRRSSVFIRDGCSVLSSTVPGGPVEAYNLGLTSVHEVGHWFGLIHTFEGGCEGEGDQVADTPAERIPAEGCPLGRNSCPYRPGKDPIHNFMDYSGDRCYREFTPGQVDRMHSYWYWYRYRS